MGALQGRTLSRQLEHYDAPLPDPDALLAVCDRVRSVPLEGLRTTTDALPACG